MAVFFTADTLFGDLNILRQRGKSFASLDKHDITLIARWNETIQASDDVWHIGDFTAGATRARCIEVFGSLNGIKRLVQGNHDTHWVLSLPWIDVAANARVTARDNAEENGVNFWRTTRIDLGRVSGAVFGTCTATHMLSW